MQLADCNPKVSQGLGLIYTNTLKCTNCVPPQGVQGCLFCCTPGPVTAPSFVLLNAYLEQSGTAPALGRPSKHCTQWGHCTQCRGSLALLSSTLCVMHHAACLSFSSKAQCHHLAPGSFARSASPIYLFPLVIPSMTAGPSSRGPGMCWLASKTRSASRS